MSDLHVQNHAGEQVFFLDYTDSLGASLLNEIPKISVSMK